MKYCRPTYRALNKVAPELAKKTFLEHADFYVSPYDLHKMRGIEDTQGLGADVCSAPDCAEDDCERFGRQGRRVDPNICMVHIVQSAVLRHKNDDDLWALLTDDCLVNPASCCLVSN